MTVKKQTGRTHWELLLNYGTAEAADMARHYKTVADEISNCAEAMARYGKLLNDAAARLENTATNPYYQLSHSAREEQAEDLLQSLRLMERILGRGSQLKQQIMGTAM